MRTTARRRNAEPVGDDVRLRRLERAAQEGDPRAWEQFTAEMVRRGLDPEVRGVLALSPQALLATLSSWDPNGTYLSDDPHDRPSHEEAQRIAVVMILDGRSSPRGVRSAEDYLPEFKRNPRKRVARRPSAALPKRTTQADPERGHVFKVKREQPRSARVWECRCGAQIHTTPDGGQTTYVSGECARLCPVAVAEADRWGARPRGPAPLGANPNYPKAGDRIRQWMHGQQNPLDESQKHDLARLKTKRKTLIEAFGDKGQRHYMAVKIGGLNPAAFELARVRREIARLEALNRPPRPTMTKGSPDCYGPTFEVSFGARVGRISRDNYGKWFVIEDREILVGNLPTSTAARDAFAKGPRRPNSDTEARALERSAVEGGDVQAAVKLCKLARRMGDRDLYARAIKLVCSLEEAGASIPPPRFDRFRLAERVDEIARPIKVETFLDEFRALWKRSGLGGQPRVTIGGHMDARHARQERAYAEVDVRGRHFYFATAVLRLPRENRVALLAHSLGIVGS